MSKTRTFLAIAPGPKTVEVASEIMDLLGAVGHSVKWTMPENLHWTLHFLGRLSDQEIFEVCEAAENAVTELRPFSLQALGLGAFPRPDRPRTVWIGAGEGGEQLSQLHARLEEQLEPLGFRGESRRYVPHLTLGRAGRGQTDDESNRLAEQIAELSDLDAGTQQVSEVVVYASRLRREGPEYQVLGRVPFG